jgi:2-polyprenyl-3-methyl-5-hydroxy-6-metoxy-1,4-benzoquinol methylase
MSFRPGEIKVLKRMTQRERADTLRKPWLHDGGGAMLAEAGAILTLLPPPPIRVLECGCGDGWLCHILSLCGYLVTGLDVCQDSLMAASRHVEWCGERSNALFAHQDWDDLPHDVYGAVIFNGSLHHSMDRRRTLRAAWVALMFGGAFLASEPGLGHQGAKAVQQWASEMDVTERSCPPYVLRRELKAAGFSGIKVYPKPSTMFGAAYGGLSGRWRPWISKMPGRTIAAMLGKCCQGLVTARKL